MKEPNTPSEQSSLTRRDFLRTSTLAAASVTAAVNFPHVLSAQTQMSFNAVIIGVGGRGNGAGRDFTNAAKEVGVDAKIVAVADIFPEAATRAGRNFGVPEAKCFSGFDSYLKALAEPGVNYAILATPPGFRPSHFRACVEAGKHVFTEKPVAVDGAGCRMMYESAEMAKAKGLKVAAGTQRRHAPNYIETIKRIHDGAIGDVMDLRAYWVNGGPIWHRGVRGDTDLEVQIRNWYHYIWLCADHCVEQHVHNIDVCNWIAGAHPVRAWGMGARQQLNGKAGEIWDNFAVEFEYANGIRMHSYCGQIKREWSSISEAVQGSKGTCNPSGLITPSAGERWRYPRGERVNPYEQEHVDLMRAILNGTELNEAAQVTDSTLTAIMGREAAYSGAAVEWDEMLSCKFKYGPDLMYGDVSKMTWGPHPTLQPPMPGQHDIFKDNAALPTV